MQSVITPLAVLTAAGVLLAFLIGFYTLIGRERKSPYLINSLFCIALPIVLGAALAIISIPLLTIQTRVLHAAIVLLFVALVQTVWRVYKIYVRFAYFVDRVSYKDLPLSRWLKNIWRTARPRGVYEHNAVSIDSCLIAEVKAILADFTSKSGSYEERPQLGENSLTVALDHHGQSTDLLVSLAAAFLAKGHTVQYLVASRHPIEFIEALRTEIDGEPTRNWKDSAQRLVIVDAFTPHFGYTDSIHDVQTRRIEADGVACLRSSVSYAGLHTAASKAFNLIKDRSNSDVRAPTLVIYEDTHSLADLESREQYRIFVRHVLPSERMWEGMFTVFTEVAPANDDWNLLRAYGGMCIDKRNSPNCSPNPTEMQS